MFNFLKIKIFIVSYRYKYVCCLLRDLVCLICGQIPLIWQFSAFRQRHVSRDQTDLPNPLRFNTRLHKYSKTKGDSSIFHYWQLFIYGR